MCLEVKLCDLHLRVTVSPWRPLILSLFSALALPVLGAGSRTRGSGLVFSSVSILSSSVKMSWQSIHLSQEETHFIYTLDLHGDNSWCLGEPPLFFSIRQYFDFHTRRRPRVELEIFFKKKLYQPSYFDFCKASPWFLAIYHWLRQLHWRGPSPRPLCDSWVLMLTDVDCQRRSKWLLLFVVLSPPVSRFPTLVSGGPSLFQSPDARNS